MTLPTAPSPGDVSPTRYHQWRRAMQKKLHRKTVDIERHILVATWQEKLAARFEHWAGRLRQYTPPLGKEGVRLRFAMSAPILGYPSYDVISVRGGIRMGKIEWSNQWRRPRFVSAPEAIFDQQCIAEIFAQMKVYK